MPRTKDCRCGGLAYLIGGIVVVVIPEGAALAQPWSAGGTADNWSEAANWSGGVPQNGGTAFLSFGASTRLTSVQDVGNPFSLASLTFQADAGNYALSGNPVKFNGSSSFHQLSASVVTVQNDLQFPGGM